MSTAVVIKLFKPNIPDLSLGERLDLPIEALRGKTQPRFYFQLEAFYLANCI